MNAVKSIWKYGRFTIGPVTLLAAIYFMAIGGESLGSYGLTLLVIFLLGDIYLGKEERIFEYQNAQIFYPIQYASQLIAIATITMFAWMLGAWGLFREPTDLLWISAAVEMVTGYDMLAAAQANNTVGTYLAALGFAGGAGALASVAVGHELTHRIDNPTAVFFGRLGQAFAMFTHFSIRHPYGHHNLVCTPADPATAKRGENFWPFAVRSTIGQYKMTWQLERDRLAKKGSGPWSIENKALRGWGMELLVAMLFFWAAGIVGLIGYLAVGVIAQTILELANYIEHYGLHRVPNEPQQIRHAWNDNTRLTYWLTWAIGRHAHHHADADVEFWNLKPVLNQAPETPFGYLATWAICTIPPIWHALMNPKLLEWDEKFATEAERELAAQANALSGQPMLMKAAEQYYREKGKQVPQPPAQPQPLAGSHEASPAL